MIGLKADEGGFSFWTGLLNSLRLRKDVTKSNSKLLKFAVKLEGFDLFFLDPELGFFLNQRIIEGNAVELATAFRGTIFGKLPLIIAKLLIEYEDIENNNKIALLCKSTEFVSRFVNLNNMLQKPFSLPLSSVTDSSVHITEAGLINLLTKRCCSKPRAK
jgi:hypothetical protein